MSGIKAEYIDHMGSDLTVVNAARVSFDKESEWDTKLEGVSVTNVLSAADTKLIAYLAKHNHWTPFSHPQITLRYTVPIFVARQEFKHVIGFTRNETSRRYVDDAPEFFAPDAWRSRPEGGVKQGSGGTHRHTEQWDDAYTDYIARAVEMYDAMLEDGIAPEQARMILPQSMLTSYYVTGSLAAFARFYRQRIDPHAQGEIQDLARQVGEIIAPLYPVSWKALTE